MRLEGKVAFISGGARGMGAVEAIMFAKEGAKVAIGDLLEDEGRKVVEQINETGGQALFVRLDVTSESEWQKAIAATVEAFGKLDVLVNNAGIRAQGKVEDVTVEAWDLVMNVNAKGTFLGTKTAIPEMRRAGGGSIVNISSQLGLVGTDRSSPQYQASKGAVRLFTKATAIQYAKDGIRTNSVHPGPTVTLMSEAGRADPQHYKLTLSRIPLGRYGEAEDIAYGVLFLASDESSYISGHTIAVAGGR